MRAPAAEVETRPPEQVGDLLLAYLTEQYRELLRQDPRVRAGEVDAVHKMRVATRRMRSALASYGRVLQPAPADRLRDELRWLAGVLGELRDPQVLHTRLRGLLSVQPAELVLGGTGRRLDEDLLTEQAAARARLLSALDEPRYASLLADLENLIRGPQRTEAAAGPAAAGGRDVVRRERRRLRRHVRAALAEPAGSGADPSALPPAGPPGESLHAARKAAKRLRYAAEAWAPVQPAEAARLAEAAEQVQKLLGEHQDAVISAAYLRSLAAGGAADGVNAFTFGRLHALEEVRADAARTAFAAAWATFPKVR